MSVSHADRVPLRSLCRIILSVQLRSLDRSASPDLHEPMPFCLSSRASFSTMSCLTCLVTFLGTSSLLLAAENREERASGAGPTHTRRGRHAAKSARRTSAWPFRQLRPLQHPPHLASSPTSFLNPSLPIMPSPAVFSIHSNLSLYAVPTAYLLAFIPHTIKLGM